MTGEHALPVLSGAGLRSFFGSRDRPRLSGDSGAVHLTGLPLSRPPAVVVSVQQVHGTDVLAVTRALASASPREGESAARGWDALVTDEPGILLTVRTADCVPVLIHDPVKGVVAAIHAGWRGTVAGIVPKTLAEMARRYGSPIEALRIGIGPAIGVCCYEVDEPVLARVRQTGVRWEHAVVERGPGRAMLDLPALVTEQAVEAGVPRTSIGSLRACTACHPDRFYSYRRDGRVLGTMVSGIMLVGPDDRA